MNDREVSRLLAQAPADAGLALQPGRQIAVLVDVFTDSTGNVTQTRIAQSTGNVALDERFMYIVGRIDFAPSLYNRRPFEVVNRIPLTITAPYP